MMMQGAGWRGLGFLVAFASVACGGDDSGSGGGGIGGMGAALAGGGSSDASSGGAAAVGAGGTLLTAGGGAAIATGGALAAGGTVATGGALPATGGTVPVTGGALATGGALPVTGGAPPNTGGTVATGGTPASGGTAQTGGTSASGGTAATGGAELTGGAAGAGGAEPTGGAVGTGGSNGDLCDVGVYDAANPPQVVNDTGTFTHDPTMIQAEDGTVHQFWTGNDVEHVATSDFPNGWSNATNVYTSGYSQWTTDWLTEVGGGDPDGTDFGFPWAPDVAYFGGQYHIYSSFSAFFGNNISCITHLTTSDINAGGWVDHGPVICSDNDDNYNAIDADVELDEGGTPWLVFGSFWDGMMLMQLNPDGSALSSDPSLQAVARADEIEGPVIFRRCGYFYLFVSHGLCCPGSYGIDNTSYRVVVGRSTSITGPYLDESGVDLMDGGGTLLVEGNNTGGGSSDYASAGHSEVIVIDDQIYHFYQAYREGDGFAELRIAEMPFDDEGWPVAVGSP